MLTVELCGAPGYDAALGPRCGRGDGDLERVKPEVRAVPAWSVGAPVAAPSSEL
jgi:hypothetical protein